MKYFYPLLICCILYSGSVFAQTPALKTNGWEAPSFDRFFVLKNHIRSIEVQSFEGSKLINPTHSTVYEYDGSGNLIHLVETEKKDTARIQKYTYTSNGTLTSKVVTDRVWDRNYKSWYRFNRMRKVYQVKSYEMLHNNETMLLNTRQYVYDEDSLLRSIRYLENRRMVRTQHYDYDEKGRVISEIFESKSGQNEREIQYTYNSEDQLTRVKTILGETNISEYIYVYNSLGNPVEVQWRENGLLIGTVTYDYNEKGLLTKMQRSVNNSDAPGSVFVRVFDYESY